MSELDDLLTGTSGSQASQQISKKLPLDRSEEKFIDNSPKNDHEMLAFLLEKDLEVKNNNEIMRTLRRREWCP